MTITATISQADLAAFEQATEKQLEHARQEAQVAMGMAFYEVVMANIGDIGADRPSEWPPLSPAYAKKVGRAHATLEVTGALRASVKMTDAPDSSTVSISDNDCPYALIHQFGSQGGVVRRSKRGRFMSNAFSKQGSLMPARPYFPITADGEPTEFAEAWVQDAAREAFMEALN